MSIDTKFYFSVCRNILCDEILAPLSSFLDNRGAFEYVLAIQGAKESIDIYDKVKWNTIATWGNVQVVSSNGYFVIGFTDSSEHILCSIEFDIIYLPLVSVSTNAAQKMAWRLILDACRYRMLLLNGVIAHGAAIEYREECIMFSGESGAGKSTQANLWRELLGASIVNYDKPCIVLRDNVLYACGMPWSGKENCYKNVRVRLRTIVFVQKSSEPHAELLSASEAFSLLYANYLPYLFNERFAELYENIIASIASTIQVYRLYSTLDYSSVLALFYKLYPKVKPFCLERISSMKIKDSYVLRQIVDEWIVIARGVEALNFKSTLVLNESGILLWKELEKGTTLDLLIECLQKEYDIDKSTATNDVNSFITKLNQAGILE